MVTIQLSDEEAEILKWVLGAGLDEVVDYMEDEVAIGPEDISKMLARTFIGNNIKVTIEKVLTQINGAQPSTV